MFCHEICMLRANLHAKTSFRFALFHGLRFLRPCSGQVAYPWAPIFKPKGLAFKSLLTLKTELPCQGQYIGKTKLNMIFFMPSGMR
jgi:hypothetical protein